MEESIQRTFKLTLVLVVISVTILVTLHKLTWAGGFLAGFCWSVVSLYFTLRLLKTVILKQGVVKLLVLVLIKFPVLYFAGFCLLASKFFPVYSLLLGGVLVFLTFGVVNICPKPKVL